MNHIKYRKIYLTENWENNDFIMIKYKHHNYQVEALTATNKWNHPMVKSGKAYWINDRELCLGYIMRENHEIFRPIFSYSRQNCLDRVNSDITNSYIFWNK